MRLHGGALLPLVIGCKEMIRFKLPMQHDGVERAKTGDACVLIQPVGQHRQLATPCMRSGHGP